MLSQKSLVGETSDKVVERIYCNAGNLPLIDLLKKGCNSVLDIGCGAGDNAVLIKSKYTECNVYGVTYSAAEAAIAQKHMVRSWIFDIEFELPADLKDQLFDGLVFSHVLEHLRNPAEVLGRFSRLLRSGGQLLIAVPNVLSWRTRFQFLQGNFEYESAGVLDDTHLRFFTYFTAEQYLLSKSPDLEVTCKTVSGSVPLWWLRRHVFPQAWSEHIDQWGCRYWPNLFGSQVLITAVKR